MDNRTKKPKESLGRKWLRWVATGLALLLFALFMDLVILNWLLRCCDGGVCWPDIYPQCRNERYLEFYGEDYENQKKNAD